MPIDGLPRHNDGTGPATALLGRICEACVHSIPVAGAAVSIMTGEGHRGVVVATDDTARRLEDVQFNLGQGPGIDAFRDGRVTLAADLAHESRWPGFGAAMADSPVAAVFAFPLQLGAATLGILMLHRREPGPLDGPDLTRAVRLANAAASALLDLLGATTGPVSGDADDEIGESGDYLRTEVHQAAGMVMVQLGVSIEVALVRLRAFAFSTGRPTDEVARDIVGRTLRLQADNEQEPGDG